MRTKSIRPVQENLLELGRSRSEVTIVLGDVALGLAVALLAVSMWIRHRKVKSSRDASSAAARAARNDHDPSTLPDVDAIDVLSLDVEAWSAAEDWFSTSIFHSAAVLEVRRASDADAETVASLWRALPPGDPARCHYPSYGLRFWQDGSVLAEASLCWQCSNAYGHVQGKSMTVVFDAKAPQAVALLATLQRLPPKQGA